jgi:hypothetical protein
VIEGKDYITTHKGGVREPANNIPVAFSEFIAQIETSPQASGAPPVRI